MLPWVKLDTATVPGDGSELRLMQRGDEFWIMSGTVALMTSRIAGSEEALATLTIERLGTRPKPRLLIGGLGMGFTLRAALAATDVSAEIVVAELVPAVIAWARGPLVPVFKGCLDDPRVTIHAGDVGQLIAGDRAGFDAIMLDVDNGPEGLSRRENDRLYTSKGLATAHAALRPKGVLAVWSSAPDPAFTKRLGIAGFEVEDAKVRARGKAGGSRHTIWLATKRGIAAAPGLRTKRE
jgi:spermidine synthase